MTQILKYVHYSAATQTSSELFLGFSSFPDSLESRPFHQYNQEREKGGRGTKGTKKDEEVLKENLMSGNTKSWKKNTYTVSNPNE